MTETERKQKARAYVRKHRYGITEEQYDNLIAEQGNACAVCRAEFTDSLRASVDHDHNCCKGTKSCGRCIRGLLCPHCLNIASYVETRFKYMDDMFLYLTHHLTNGGRNT